MGNRALLAATVAAALSLGCGKATQDLSYTNPEWRSSVQASVSFPLAEQVTLRVGLGAGMTAPSPDSASLAWLEKKTNIKLESVSLAGGPSGVDASQTGGIDVSQIAGIQLGEMIRSGRLPDIVPEGSIDLNDESVRNLFVDVLEFPELTSSFRKAVAAAPRFRDGLLARLSAGDKLYSMATYNPDLIAFAGVLAYRQDIFQAKGLKTDSWQSIRRSLQELKTAYPKSYPFGGQFSTLLTLMPSWFGSGYDKNNIIYFDNDSAAWRFGPYEAQFEDMVRFLADLYKQGLMSPDIVSAREDSTSGDFSNNTMFLAPYYGPTGPYFRFDGDYGKVTPEGKWNGEGAWISSLPLPPPPSGGTAKVSTRRFSSAADGWLVYNQSKHVGEAVAMLDLLFTDEASRILGLGPVGTAWRLSGSKVELLEPYRAAYLGGGTASLSEKLKAAGIETAFPLKGLVFDFFGALGYPEDASYRYYLQHDAAVNRLGVDLYAETGLRIPTYDKDFADQRGKAVVSLQTQIESQVAKFIMGQRNLDEYGAFKEELRKMGAEQLLELFRAHATVGDPKVLAGR